MGHLGHSDVGRHHSLAVAHRSMDLLGPLGAVRTPQSIVWGCDRRIS